MVYHVSQSTTYLSISRANSLLFQSDFLIAGNFPSKESAIYNHLLLMCFQHFSCHFSFVSKWEGDKTFPSRQGWPLLAHSKAGTLKTRRRESISPSSNSLFFIQSNISRFFFMHWWCILIEDISEDWSVPNVTFFMYYQWVLEFNSLYNFEMKTLL